MNKTFTFQDDLPIDYLKEGKVIALPTDTVYGLAIKADSSEGYKRLIEIKKRPFDKPIYDASKSNLSKRPNEWGAEVHEGGEEI